MEEDRQTQVSVQPEVQNSTSSERKRGSKKKKIITIVVLLIVLGGLAAGGYFLLKEPNFDESDNIDSSLTTPENNSQPTSTPSPTPEPIDKSEVKINILNGTGIAGEASKLRDALASIGYKEIEVGNATSTDNITTQVTFSESLDKEIIDEIESELKDTYAKVNSDTDSSPEYDVVIIIGYKAGYTPAPTKSPTTTPKATPTGSISPTPTTTTSPTPTP